jgi:diguanylate cyclase (GGDEF)-like protein
VFKNVAYPLAGGNGRDDVNEVTRERVINAAADLRFSPNPFARALLTRQMGAIGMLTANLDNRSVLPILFGAEDAFGEDDVRFAESVANALSGAVRRLQTQTRLAYMAEFDALTGLPNRNLLQDRLMQTVAQARRRGEQGAVLFIDLDRFKLINDTLGHHVGDRLIAEVGVRLMQCVRADDTVGRVSGDEFGVVLSGLQHVDDAAIVAQKILGALSRPFDLEGTEAYVTASIGISVFPADGEAAETLLKNADMAMYRAKEMTRNAYCFFTAEMNRRSVAKLQLNTDLRRAMERGEFALHYQPKVDLRDGKLLGVEALLRWQHPARGMVLPAEFIPALEDSGLILPVGEWVLAQACAQLRRWQAQGFGAVPVAVNLSAKQFHRPDLDTLVRRVLAAEGCVSLIERLWPALEHIDTSSGALGGAVHRTLDELMAILVSAPADVATRSAWLDRLFQDDLPHLELAGLQVQLRFLAHVARRAFKNLPAALWTLPQGSLSCEINLGLGFGGRRGLRLPRAWRELEGRAAILHHEERLELAVCLLRDKSLEQIRPAFRQQLHDLRRGDLLLQDDLAGAEFAGPGHARLILANEIHAAIEHPRTARRTLAQRFFARKINRRACLRKA